MSPCRAPPFAAARKNWLWLTAVFSDREARAHGVGGEILCEVW